MSQAVWTGSISFGLVHIPVKLYPATEPKDVRFHLYDRRTGKRIRYERITRDEESATFAPEPELTVDLGPGAPSAPAPSWPAPAAEPSWPTPDAEPSLPTRPVEREDIVRGTLLPSGDLVTIDEEELVSIAPERSRTIDIEEFVDLGEIDPVFFEKSYHVAPLRGAGAEKPYALLLRAMQAARMVGIGRFVLRTKPHLVAIRPLENVLGLETLFFGDEVRDPAALVGGIAATPVSERELKTAQQLITALATEWVPEKHGDLYREELLELLRSKRPAVPAEPLAPITETPVADLMAVLRASVEEAKRKKAPKPSPKVSKRRAG